MKYLQFVEPSQILRPPLCIKLGIIKNVDKAMERNGSGFLYRQEKSPKLSDAEKRENFSGILNEKVSKR